MPSNVLQPVQFACTGAAILVKLRRFVCLDLDLCFVVVKLFLGGRLQFKGTAVLTFHFVQSPVGKANAKWMKDAIILICSITPTS